MILKISGLSYCRPIRLWKFVNGHDLYEVKYATNYLKTVPIEAFSVQSVSYLIYKSLPIWSVIGVIENFIFNQMFAVLFNRNHCIFFIFFENFCSPK